MEIEICTKFSLGIQKNTTLAKLLYNKAAELESVYSEYGYSWATTNGFAPLLASTLASIESWIGGLNQWNIPQEELLLLSMMIVLVGIGMVKFFRNRNL